MPLGEPPAPHELARLTGLRLAGRALHRIFRADRTSPWWFASTEGGSGGRFDLPTPDGTCYLATSAVGAVLEAFQDFGGILPLAELRNRRRAIVMVPPSAPPAAALVSARARGFGVTQALWAGAGRGLTQRWARALRRGGWLALWTGAQHDPTGRARTVSLFDEAGEHLPYEDPAWDFEVVSLAGDVELALALTRFGLHVVPDLDPPFLP